MRLTKTILRALVVAALWPVLISQDTTVQASSGVCQSYGTVNVRRYSDGALLATGTFSRGPITDPDYSVCLSAAQGQAVANCATACGNAGVSPGSYGIAYCVTNWNVLWDSEYQGNVHQQYDCGDM